ncbi:MAG: fumarylacetoacetate hydrolase family protein [Wenzhouxiangella sp.]|jgi:fumarylpyruvate hydrolase|nr:fumarylacetoacetate hydrolase family protein [Wenzhouxiangella sp.]
MVERVVDWQAPLLPVLGGGAFPVRTVWCLGRNYAEHAREMGVDPDRSAPVFFSKPAQALVHADCIDYPPDTADLHHEVELIVFLKGGGRSLTSDQASGCIFGYAVGVDLTRRDVQARAKQAGQPWEMSKGFDSAGPVGQIVPAQQARLDAQTAISLTVDGELRQSALLGDMLWSVAELLCELSRTVSLSAGDVIFTGTPAGVSALLPGQEVRASVEGLPQLVFRISP